MLLERATRSGVRASIVTAQERIELIASDWSAECGEVGDLVSLIPLSETVSGVRTQGLRFPLHGETLARHETRGLSNRIRSLPAEVQIQRGLLLVVHRMRSAGERATMPPA
jgi:thiamine pyrophosphokinase